MELSAGGGGLKNNLEEECSQKENNLDVYEQSCVRESGPV
jgi:hypothetical protein